VSEAPIYRPITGDDVDELAEAVAEAFAGYGKFAPADWHPPPASEQARGLRRWIADPGFWGELAAHDRAIIGHVTVTPAARHSFRAATDPELAHLGHLFVAPGELGQTGEPAHIRKQHFRIGAHLPTISLNVREGVQRRWQRSPPRSAASSPAATSTGWCARPC
jgi:hypothetical protein